MANLDVVLSIRLSEDLHTAATAAATAEDLTLSQYIRRAIRNQLDTTKGN